MSGKNRAGPPALKAGFENLFGPPSIESNAILPESLSLRLAFKFDTFEAVKSSDFEVFSFFFDQGPDHSKLNHSHCPVK